VTPNLALEAARESPLESPRESSLASPLASPLASAVQPLVQPKLGRTRAGLRRGLSLAAGGLLLAVVLLGLAAVALYDREQQIAQVRERSELMARMFADSLTRNVESTALATATLAELLASGLAPEGAEIRTAVKQTLVNLSFLRGIAILDVQGQVLASADEAELGRVIDLAPFGPLPAAGRDGLGPYVAARRLLDLASGGARGAPGAVGAPAPAGVGFLPLLRKVKVGSRQLLLVAMINPAAFTNFQQVTLNDQHAAAAILTYGGRLVASTATGDAEGARPVGADLGALPPFTAFLPRIESGSWIGDGLRAGRQIAAFRVSASRPLLVTVEYSFDAATAAWLRRSQGLMLAALAATLLIGAMTVIAARSLRARELARAALDSARRVTAERERELNVTVQSLQELIFRTDAAGVISYVNPRWRSVTDADIGTSGAIGAIGARGASGTRSASGASDMSGMSGMGGASTTSGGVHLWDLVIRT